MPFLTLPPHFLTFPPFDIVHRVCYTFLTMGEARPSHKPTNNKSNKAKTVTAVTERETPMTEPERKLTNTLIQFALDAQKFSAEVNNRNNRMRDLLRDAVDAIAIEEPAIASRRIQSVIKILTESINAHAKANQ